MMCDTLSDYTHAHQTPMLAVAGGSGTFEAEAAADSATPNEETGRYTHRQTGVDFTIRKVPMTGVIQLSLYRTTRLGQSCVAHASLHLDAVQHQLEGGLETEHHVQLRAAKGGREALGEVRLKAFWMSTELERLEMELVAVQVPFPHLQLAIGAWHFIPLSLQRAAGAPLPLSTAAGSAVKAASGEFKPLQMLRIVGSTYLESPQNCLVKQVP
jgi:hypothetical protein